MSELLSTLEAPVYIERVALSDNKNIMRARRAIRKALENQRDNLGFSFVEILSPCPTIWGKDPVDARRWVAEQMIPSFPLNVFRDRKLEIPPGLDPPQRSVSEVLEIRNEEASGPSGAHPHDSSSSPSSWQALADKVCCCSDSYWPRWACAKDLEVSWLPSYGPEMRSGSANCHVCLSTQRIGSPLVSRPQVLIAMSEIPCASSRRRWLRKDSFFTPATDCRRTLPFPRRM